MLSWPATILYALGIVCFTFTLVTAMRATGKAEDRKLRERSIALAERKEERLAKARRALMSADSG